MNERDFLFFPDASVIKAQESITCVAENKYGKDAEDKVDCDNGDAHGECIAVWDKHDENAEQSVGDVYDNSVICLDYEALEIYGIAFALELIFVEACKSSKLGNLILPRLYLQLVVEILFLL